MKIGFKCPKASILVSKMPCDDFALSGNHFISTIK